MITSFISNSVADPAATTVGAFLNISILLCVLMSVGAMGDRFAHSLEVFFSCYFLKMFRVNTGTISAKMVNFQFSIWHSNKILERPSVCQKEFPRTVKLTIPFVVFCSSPNPARSNNRIKRIESFYRSLHYYVRDNSVLFKKVIMMGTIALGIGWTLAIFKFTSFNISLI